MRDDEHIDGYGLHLLRLLGVVVVMGVVVALAGCATVPQPQPVNVVAHDYCKIASKISWDVHDTRETIQSVRRENAKIDVRCRKDGLG